MKGARLPHVLGSLGQNRDRDAHFRRGERPVDTWHCYRRRALRARVDDPATASCKHEEISDDSCTVASADEGTDRLS